MIDARFSVEAFEALGTDTDESRQLAQLLGNDIQNEIHKAVLPKLEEMIQELNSLGHNLRPYGDQQPGDVSFRDDSLGPAGYKCNLRVSVDFIVSTGYSHLFSHET
jgi:hypothetical protein